MNKVWLFLFLLGFTSFLPRVIPMLFLQNRELSPRIQRWMTFIPVTIFSALVFSDIFFWEDSLNVNPLINLKLIPSLLVVLVSLKFKNVLVSMIVGVLAIALMALVLT